MRRFEDFVYYVTFLGDFGDNKILHDSEVKCLDNGQNQLTAVSNLQSASFVVQ